MNITALGIDPRVRSPNGMAMASYRSVVLDTEAMHPRTCIPQPPSGWPPPPLRPSPQNIYLSKIITEWKAIIHEIHRIKGCPKSFMK